MLVLRYVVIGVVVALLVGFGIFNTFVSGKVDASHASAEAAAASTSAHDTPEPEETPDPNDYLLGRVAIGSNATVYTQDHSPIPCYRSADALDAAFSAAENHDSEGFEDAASKAYSLDSGTRVHVVSRDIAHSRIEVRQLANGATCFIIDSLDAAAGAALARDVVSASR